MMARINANKRQKNKGKMGKTNSRKLDRIRTKMHKLLQKKMNLKLKKLKVITV